MPRPNRFTPSGVPIHVTQRGNFRQQTFTDDRDYRFFLHLLSCYSVENCTRIVGYCLMPNHFHLILVPERDEIVPTLMQGLTSSYARAVNQQHERSGHLWQARYFSVAMDTPHFCKALAYVDLNPSRASLVENPADYAWSSAQAHLGAQRYPEFLDSAAFTRLYTPEEWREVLQQGLNREELYGLRRATRCEGLAGSQEFIRQMETKYGRPLGRRSPGRPRLANGEAAAAAP
jgi:putative transposase